MMLSLSDTALVNPLLETLRLDDVESLSRLLAAHPHLAERPLDVPLQLVEFRSVAGPKYWVELASDPPESEKLDRRPLLTLAVWLHAQQCFDFLLAQHDATLPGPQQALFYGQALWMAATCDFPHGIDHLLEREHVAPEYAPQRPLLHLVVQRCSRVDLDLFKRVMAVSSPRTLDALGRSALMHAAHSGSTQWVRLLLPESDLYAQDRLGHDALFYALAFPQAMLLLLDSRDEHSERLAQEQALLLFAEQAAQSTREQGISGVALMSARAQPLKPLEKVEQSIFILRARQERRDIQALLGG